MVSIVAILRDPADDKSPDDDKVAIFYALADLNVRCYLLLELESNC